MKKILAVILTVLLLMGTMSLAAFATDGVSASVYVTIADKDGKLALVQEKITVIDLNADGKLTIDEALYAAHEAKYEGGAAAGYKSENTEYGLSLTKLWGTSNGGSYGYYVNNASAWSLSDEVKEGDYINAFVYTDTESWSDTYCWFNINATTVDAGQKIDLTLMTSVYDVATSGFVTTPVANAFITVDGVKTEVKTDSDGKASIIVDGNGNHVISAVSDTQNLVPPVFTVTVNGEQVPNGEQPNEEQPNNQQPEIPNTSSENFVAFAGVFAMISLCGVVIVKGKKAYEK